MGTVHKYNQLMDDFPLNDLLSSTDLNKVHESLTLIFSHLNRKLRVSPTQSVGDFNDVLLQILTSHRLAYTPYPTFERLLAQTTGIFRTWDDLIKE